jgi:hypothetical protein
VSRIIFPPRERVASSVGVVGLLLLLLFLSALSRTDPDFPSFWRWQPWCCAFDGTVASTDMAIA